MKNLSKYFLLPSFPFSGKTKRCKTAIRDITLNIREEETLALVGESGCGKSTLARMILGLEVPSSGELRLFGRDTRFFLKRDWRLLRPRMQMIFQNPYTFSDPKYSIEESLMEALRQHGTVASRDEGIHRIIKVLEECDLSRDVLERFPHQLSGGQLQRIAIVLALLPSPDILIADEMFSALDVSVKLQIIEMLERIRQKKKMACLFITHNLGLARRIADKIAVMKGGEIVEVQSTERLFQKPENPYTRSLIESIPRFGLKE